MISDEVEAVRNGRCNYCGKPTQRVDTAELYGVHVGWCIICRPCNAWVGEAEDGTPKGTLAKAHLRSARARAHRLFDPLWRAKMKRDGCTQALARGAGYAWLRAIVGGAVEHAHIGMFNEEQCEKVIAAITNLKRRPT